jgi:hypothetical protein
MIIAYRVALVGALLVLAPASETKADPEECREAIDKYNSATSDVSDALRRYANCVRDSVGHDDCSSEFSRSRSAQEDFESAVSAYETDCQ